MFDSKFLYRLAGLIGAAVAVITSVSFLVPLLIDRAVLPDFTIFWTAGRFALAGPSHVYDTTTMTLAQAWAVDPARGPRPFSYPPSALLLLAPFGLMPFWIAYSSWVGFSAIAFWTATRRIADGWAIPLSLTTPHVILALILGQTTLIMGSLIIWSLAVIRERPFLAGMLLGAAAALKPQSVLLAPIAMISGGHWRTLVASALTLCVLVLASLVFGAGLWSDWFSALQAFPREVLETHRLFAFGLTPWMFGRTLGIGPTAAVILQLVGVVAGVCAVWWGFKSSDIALRVCALVAGGLLASPYALRYELATLAPIFATGLLSGTLLGLVGSVPVFALNSLTAVPALIASLSSQFLSKSNDGRV